MDDQVDVQIGCWRSRSLTTMGSMWPLRSESSSMPTMPGRGVGSIHLSLGSGLATASHDYLEATMIGVTSTAAKRV